MLGQNLSRRSFDSYRRLAYFAESSPRNHYAIGCSFTKWISCGVVSFQPRRRRGTARDRALPVAYKSGSCGYRTPKPGRVTSRERPLAGRLAAQLPRETKARPIFSRLRARTERPRLVRHRSAGLRMVSCPAPGKGARGLTTETQRGRAATKAAVGGTRSIAPGFQPGDPWAVLNPARVAGDRKVKPLSPATRAQFLTVSFPPG